MDNAIVVALITSIIPLVGTIITVLYSASKTDEKLKITQAVMETRLEELVREVRTHNDFAQRIPSLETKVEHLERQVTRLQDDNK